MVSLTDRTQEYSFIVCTKFVESVNILESPSPLPLGRVGGETSASLIFRSKKMKTEALTPSKNLHGKNQRVCKNQISRYEEMSFTIRDNLVD